MMNLYFFCPSRSWWSCDILCTSSILEQSCCVIQEARSRLQSNYGCSCRRTCWEDEVWVLHVSAAVWRYLSWAACWPTIRSIGEHWVKRWWSRTFGIIKVRNKTGSIWSMHIIGVHDRNATRVDELRLIEMRMRYTKRSTIKYYLLTRPLKVSV